MINGRKFILIIGIQHTGSTMLASALGAHPDISIVNEGLHASFTCQVGTEYIGNKVVLGYFHPNLKKIRIITAIVNRFTGIFIPNWKWSLLPKALYSINELVEMADHIVCIYRNSDDVIKSTMNRNKVPLWFAKFLYRRWQKQWVLINHKKKAISVLYSNLVKDPDNTLKRILQAMSLDASPEIIDRMKEGAAYNYAYSRPL